jgi:hypothetical protein
MKSFVVVVFATALAAVPVLLGYGLAAAWRRALRDLAPLPLFGRLRLEGLSPGEAREAVGVRPLAYAARRCARCASRPGCNARIAAGRAPTGYCPNARLLAELRLPRA